VDQDIDGSEAALREIVKEQKAKDKYDRDRVEAFRLLEKQEGWKLYQSLLAYHLQTTSDKLLQPAGGFDGLVSTEYQKGAMYGLILARDLVRATVATDEEARKSQTADSAEQEIEDE
jgi:hypothetical protein